MVFSIVSIRSIFGGNSGGSTDGASALERRVTSTAGQALLGGLISLKELLQSNSYEKRSVAFTYLRRSKTQDFASLKRKERKALSQELKALKKEFGTAQYKVELHAMGAEIFVQEKLAEVARLMKGSIGELLAAKGFTSAAYPDQAQRATTELFDAQKQVLKSHEAAVLRMLRAQANAEAQKHLVAIKNLGFCKEAFVLIHRHGVKILDSDSKGAFEAHLASLESKFKAVEARHKKEQKSRAADIEELREYADFRRGIEEMLHTDMRGASEATLSQLQIQLLKAKKGSAQALQIQGMMQSVTAQLVKEQNVYEALKGKTVLEAKGTLPCVQHELLLQRIIRIIEEEQATPLYRKPLRELFVEAPAHLAEAQAEYDKAREAFEQLSINYTAGLKRVVTGDKGRL